MKFSHDHEKIVHLTNYSRESRKNYIPSTYNSIQVQVETITYTLTHTRHFLRTIRYKNNPSCTTANSPFEMRLVEATLTFVEERKCHLENQQLAVTGLQDGAFAFSL